MYNLFALKNSKILKKMFKIAKTWKLWGTVKTKRSFFVKNQSKIKNKKGEKNFIYVLLFSRTLLKSSNICFSKRRGPSPHGNSRPEPLTRPLSFVLRRRRAPEMLRQVLRLRRPARRTRQLFGRRDRRRPAGNWLLGHRALFRRVSAFVCGSAEAGGVSAAPAGQEGGSEYARLEWEHGAAYASDLWQFGWFLCLYLVSHMASFFNYWTILGPN